jgi:hypothetical protein
MAEKPGIKGAGSAAVSRSSRDRGQAQPVGADPAVKADVPGTDSAPGQLARDERGNITWEWSDDPELQADDILGGTARLRALAPKNLSIEDTRDDLATVKSDPVPTRKTPKSGYNPYDSGEPTKQTWKKKRDLRELDKWIALKKRMRDKSGEN